LATNVSTILTTVNTISSKIGNTTDASTVSSVFGNLQKVDDYVDNVETLIGSTSDSESTSSVFGSLSKLTLIKTNVGKAKSSAESALGEAQGIRKELGAKGQEVNVYNRIEKLRNYLSELSVAARTIAESQVESGDMASEILGVLSNFVNEGAKAVGMEGQGITTEGLTPMEATSEEKVQEKLNEILAKLSALKESVETGGVTVKTWFESGE